MKVEYKLMHGHGNLHWVSLKRLHPNDKSKIGKSFYIRIDGIEYTKQGPALDKAMEQVLFWQVLTVHLP